MRVLFFMPAVVMHSGAEMALFNLIHHVAGRGWEMAVAAHWRGPMLKELPPGVRVFVDDGPNALKRVRDSFRYRFLGRRGDFAELVHEKFRPDLWYVNTVVLPWVVEEARRLRVPCALHAHELEQALSDFDQKRTEALVTYPRLFLACSEAAREVYRTLGRSDIEVFYPALDPRRMSWSPEASARIRRALGVRDSTFLWTTAGGFDSNKNPLLFVEVAARMLREGSDAHFMWVGGVADNGYSLYVKERAKALGVADRVSFVGNRAGDYYDHLAAADGAVVTSTYESFSVFAAEAAYLGKPVVTFDCGGVREIVRPGMGAVVGSRDPDNLIRGMVGVMEGRVPFDPRVARERVGEFLVGAQGERWARLVEERFANVGRRGS